MNYYSSNYNRRVDLLPLTNSKSEIINYNWFYHSGHNIMNMSIYINMIINVSILNKSNYLAIDWKPPSIIFFCELRVYYLGIIKSSWKIIYILWNINISIRLKIYKNTLIFVATFYIVIIRRMQVIFKTFIE